MKLTHIHLFLILLASLVLCSFLGGVGCTTEGMEDNTAADDENEDEDDENNTDDSDEVKIVMVNKNGQISGKLISNNDYNEDYYSSEGNVTSYYGPQGNEVVSVKGPNGNQILVEADYNTKSYSQSSYNNGVSTTSGSNGGYAATGPNGNTVVSGPNGNTAVVNGNTAVVNGDPVSKSQIAPGDEDLYILKSQIVPPVCPVCPGIKPAYLNDDDDADDLNGTSTTITGPKGNSVSKTTNSGEKCPPCPACARCPEPSFDCKKVPSYKQGSSNAFLPRPVLSDFSTFGM